MSPIGLVTNIPANHFNRLEIKKGDHVAVESDSIIFCLMRQEKTIVFSCGQTATTDLSLSAVLPDQRILVLLQGLWSGLLALETRGLRTVFLPLGQGQPITVTALARTVEAERFIAAEEWDSAAECLSGLIGLGIGLTPSGDDFLCGVLAGTVLTGLDSHPFSWSLRRQIRSGLSGTNDISRTFLQSALDGHYGATIQLFYTHSAEDILDGMRQIGHTSGIDTLCGILYSFQIWKKFRDGPDIQKP